MAGFEIAVFEIPDFNLPILTGNNALPVGVQLVGRYQEDDRLIRTSNWLVSMLRKAKENA